MDLRPKKQLRAFKAGFDEILGNIKAEGRESVSYKKSNTRSSIGNKFSGWMFLNISSNPALIYFNMFLELKDFQSQ